MKPILRSFAVLLGSLPVVVACLTGCSEGVGSEPGDDADEAVSESRDALVSCGAAKYNEALAHYKNAVAWSKEREAAKFACESEHGYQWGIADEASAAVMTCAAFRDVVKTSKWAAPVRRVLGDSLTLRSLTGELLVIKDSRWQNWTGVEKWFATPEGLTFWAQANGAYGSTVRVEFGAGGIATYHWLTFDEQTFEASWKSERGTYTISRAGAASDKPTVKVRHGKTTETFTLGVESGFRYDSAPIFTLSPAGAATKAPKLYSLVDECSA
jgi:hypothetical protein